MLRLCSVKEKICRNGSESAAGRAAAVSRLERQRWLAFQEIMMSMSTGFGPVWG
jgi:hypothetical protein